MNIEIETNTLCKLGLTLSEYVYLLNIYNKEKDPNLYKVIDYVDELKLEKEGYIKISTNGTVLRTKGIELFEKDELFLKFLTMYPIKSPNGRYLSPAGTTGKLMKEALKAWVKAFGKNTAKKEKALKVLDAELEWRKKQNNLNFMPEIKPWLNQRYYEKYEYLLQDQKDENTSQFNDLM